MRNDIPNFNLLAVFAAVMEHGSFSRAADYMDTNQSTISTAINRLKKQIGKELFIRQGRGVVPTTFANNLYAQIKLPIQELNNVYGSLGEFNPKLASRQFVITAPEHLQGLLLEQFHDTQCPKLTLKVFDQKADDQRVFDSLQTQQYDLMIDIVPPSHHNILSKNLYSGQFAIVCSHQHPRINGSLTVEQYLQETHAVLERTRKQMHTLAHFTDLDLSQRKVSYHGRSLFSNLLMTSQSECLTVVPLSMAEQYAERLQLQILTPPFNYQLVNNYMIWLNKMDNDPAHLWLRQRITDIIDRNKNSNEA
jgi:DNA-binding transcriptional LysR family regulator